jgi:hypothetical protein
MVKVARTIEFEAIMNVFQENSEDAGRRRPQDRVQASASEEGIGQRRCP